MKNCYETSYSVYVALHASRDAKSYNRSMAKHIFSAASATAGSWDVHGATPSALSKMAKQRSNKGISRHHYKMPSDELFELLMTSKLKSKKKFIEALELHSGVVLMTDQEHDSTHTGEKSLEDLGVVWWAPRDMFPNTHCGFKFRKGTELRFIHEVALT